jgi:large conductance mechanosensitive channel
MLKEFRNFILRGNVVDLAVAVVIGAAFGAIVTALVKDLLTPLIAAVVHKPDFSALVFTINGSKFLYGEFLNALIAFLLIAAAVYFFVVLPMNTLLNKFKKPMPELPPATKPCPECLSDVPAAARRCAHCAQPV